MVNNLQANRDKKHNFDSKIAMFLKIWPIILVNLLCIQLTVCAV